MAFVVGVLPESGRIPIRCQKKKRKEMKDLVVFGLMSIVFLASLVGLALAPETNSKRASLFRSVCSSIRQQQSNEKRNEVKAVNSWFFLNGQK
jgi:hypothetical protein